MKDRDGKNLNTSHIDRKQRQKVSSHDAAARSFFYFSKLQSQLLGMNVIQYHLARKWGDDKMSIRLYRWAYLIREF